MIKRGNIPLSVYNFTELKAALPSRQIRLIEKNINTYFKTKEDYPLDKGDYESLILSDKVTEKNKIKIAEFIQESDLRLMKNVADKVSLLLVKNGHLSRPYEKIDSLLIHGSSPNSLKLFSMHIGDFNEVQNRQLLTNLGGKFQEINNKKKNPTFEPNPVNTEILKALKSQNIIVDYKPYKDLLKVYYTIQK